MAFFLRVGVSAAPLTSRPRGCMSGSKIRPVFRDKTLDCGPMSCGQCPLLAQSRHELVRCTCPLLGAKRYAIAFVSTPSRTGYDISTLLPAASLLNRGVLVKVCACVERAGHFSLLRETL